MIGKVVSHYKVLEKLGEGGMGVVYKAFDTELDRTVALKFLPHALTPEQSEQARFLQEAKAASALNHPNICTVHSLGEHEGQRFIDMEFVDGKALREIIPAKKPQDAITYAIQIAEALGEAHTHGIVHRDIKAENIMVNSKNQVKVMDFGLAKLKGSLKLTRTSSTVGTLAYMAPEQIQGGEVDARGDIFSFGVVLYEMLTGHLPFRGEHEAAMVYSIVNEEPAPLQKYLPDASSELVHILDRALEKDPEDRYQSVHDMVIDLRRLRKDTSRVSRQMPSTEASHRVDVPPTPAELSPRNRRWFRVVALAVVAVAAGLAVLFFTRTGSVKLNPNPRISTISQPFTDLGYPCISRDGNWVVFPAADENGKWDVYWMMISGSEPSRVTYEEWMAAPYVDLSPDAGHVAMTCPNLEVQSFQIRVVPLQGGSSRFVADSGNVSRWRPDGKRIGYLRVGKGTWHASSSGRFEIWSVKPDGSDNRIELTDSLSWTSRLVDEAPKSFSWSPDGKWIAWVRIFSPSHGEVMLRELATGRERQLTHENARIDEVLWTAGDRIIFMSNRSGHSNLWAIPAGGGEAIQVTTGASAIKGAKMSADEQRLVYLQQEDFSHIWISGSDGSNARQLTSDESNIQGAAFSPDGNSIAYVRSGGDVSSKPESHLYLIDRQGKNRRQLTFGAEIIELGLVGGWSPDGNWLAYLARPVGEPLDSSKAYAIQPSDPGAPQLLGNGLSLIWVDSANLLVDCPDTTLHYSLPGWSSSQRTHQDSIVVYPFVKWLEESLGKDVRLRGLAFSPDRNLMFYHEIDDSSVWRLRAPSVTKERAGTIPSAGMVLSSVSRNGKELLWMRPYTRSKLAMIENLFED